MISFTKWYEQASYADIVTPKQIFIPGPNLNVPRAKMPQILTKLLPDFLTYLRKNEIKIKKEKILASCLRPIQKEIDREKVILMMKRTDLESDAPPIVTIDNYILDGHHRWLAILNLAMHNKEQHKMPVWRADVKIKHLLNITKKWPEIKYKSL